MDLIVYDEIIRFEDIGERLPNIIAELHPCAAADGNATSAIISRKRNDRTAEEYVAAYFTDELRQIVDHIYRLDFETFDFERLGSRTASPARVPAKARSPHLEAALARA